MIHWKWINLEKKEILVRFKGREFKNDFNIREITWHGKFKYYKNDFNREISWPEKFKDLKNHNKLRWNRRPS